VTPEDQIKYIEQIGNTIVPNHEFLNEAITLINNIINYSTLSNINFLDRSIMTQYEKIANNFANYITYIKNNDKSNAQIILGSMNTNILEDTYYSMLNSFNIIFSDKSNSLEINDVCSDIFSIMRDYTIVDIGTIDCYHNNFNYFRSEMSIITKPIIITYEKTEYNLGIYLIKLYFTNDDTNLIPCVIERIFPYNNPIEPKYPDGSDVGFYHPHVSTSGHICYGNIKDAANMTRQQFRIYDLLDVIHNTLSSYSERDPYAPIYCWASEKCKSCGTLTNQICASCGEYCCSLCLNNNETICEFCNNKEIIANETVKTGCLHDK
jgi:ubiquitin-protein ligase